LRRRATTSRASQELPPQIADPAVLDQIADLLVVTLSRPDRKRPDPCHPSSSSTPLLDDNVDRRVGFLVGTGGLDGWRARRAIETMVERDLPTLPLMNYAT
jgi:hypothetical protein